MTVVKSIRGTCTEGTSDKEYRVQIEDHEGTYAVSAFYGRRGGNLKLAPQGSGFDLARAEKVFTSTVNGKSAKYYFESVVGSSGAAASVGVATVLKARESTGMRAQLLTAITQDQALAFINDDYYGAELKFDGERTMVTKVGGAVVAANRNGIATTIPPELETALLAVPHDFIVDGELVEGSYHIFDLLSMGGGPFTNNDFQSRHQYAEMIFRDCLAPIFVTRLAIGIQAKCDLFAFAKENRLEGIVFKRLTASWTPGRGGDQYKCKFWAELSAIVSGINDKRSVSLELIDLGIRIPVGNVLIKANQQYPSVGDVVEIKYLYVKGVGGALYQPEFKMVRTDIDPSECTLEQIKYRGQAA